MVLFCSSCFNSSSAICFFLQEVSDDSRLIVSLLNINMTDAIVAIIKMKEAKAIIVARIIVFCSLFMFFFGKAMYFYYSGLTGFCREAQWLLI